MQFEQAIRDCFIKELELYDFISIAPNTKRGQSITYTVYDLKGNPKWIVKFFNYLEQISQYLRIEKMKNYENLIQFIDDIDNAGDFIYDIEDIIDYIDLQKRCFDRYVKVEKNDNLCCFPNLVYYKTEIKINNSFYGILIEEFICGDTLEKRLESSINNKKYFVLDFLVQLGNILGELSAFGIIHRDLSPDNIMLVDNKYILIDPGVVKIDDGITTRTGLIMGKKIYASPEQFIGNAKWVKIQSDLYSVGIIALEIILGYNPLEQILRNTANHNYPHQELLDRYNRDIEDYIYKEIEEDKFSNRLLFIIKKMIQIEDIYRFDSIESFLLTLNTLKGMVNDNE